MNMRRVMTVSSQKAAMEIGQRLLGTINAKAAFGCDPEGVIVAGWRFGVGVGDLTDYDCEIEIDISDEFVRLPPHQIYTVADWSEIEDSLLLVD